MDEVEVIEPSGFAEFMDWASEEEDAWSQADFEEWFTTDEE